MIEKKRPSITSINHYNMLPVNGGGCMAIMDFYTALSAWCDINLVAFSTDKKYRETFQVNNHFTIYFLAISDELNKKKQELFYNYNMCASTIIDIAPVALKLFPEDEDLCERVRKIGERSDVIIAEHIYAWNIIKKVFSDKRIWYRAHNVEYDYKIYDWKTIGVPADLIKEVYVAEEDACKSAEHILTISFDDMTRFCDLYHAADRKNNFYNLSAGYFITNDTFCSVYERNINKNKSIFTGFYIGTDTPGGRRVVDQCIAVARQCGDIAFVIAGTVCNSFKNYDQLENITLLGRISDTEKNYYLSTCDFAVNIIEDGAGVNIKMFEYFAYGIPVIASKHGVRGIDVKAQRECLIIDNKDFMDTIYYLKNMPNDSINKMVENAYRLLVERYSWQALAKKVMNIVDSRLKCDFQNVPTYKDTVFTGADYSEKLRDCSANIYLRCLGDWGRRCLSKLEKANVRITKCIDNNPQYREDGFAGIPVISIDSLHTKDDDVVIVAIENCEKVIQELLLRNVKKEQIYLYGYCENKIFKLDAMSTEGPNYLCIDNLVF